MRALLEKMRETSRLMRPILDKRSLQPLSPAEAALAAMATPVPWLVQCRLVGREEGEPFLGRLALEMKLRLSPELLSLIQSVSAR